MMINVNVRQARHSVAPTFARNEDIMSTTESVNAARRALHLRAASWEDVRAAYVTLRDLGRLTADDERMADWHECTDAWADTFVRGNGTDPRPDYDSSAWTATHADGTACNAWMVCNLSHGWVDAHHEDHE